MADSPPKSPSGATILPSNLPTRRDRPGRTRMIIRWTLGVGLTVAVIVGGALVAKPLYKKWEGKKGEEMAAQADLLMKREQWDEASRLLGEAYRRAPENLEVMRGILELITQSSPNAERQLYFYRKISTMAPLTLEEKVRMAECHLALRQGDEAREILEEFTPAEKEGRYGLELQALLLRAEGRGVEAVALLRRALEQAPEDPSARARLAAMDLRSAFSEVQASASAILWDLARGRDQTALSAMEILSSEAKLSPLQAGELWTLVNDHPWASARRRLGVLAAYVKSDPSQKGAVLDAETTRIEALPIDQRTNFLRWLAGTGEPERFLKLVTVDRALLVRDLFQPYVEALAATQQWDALKDMLQKGGTNTPLSPAEKALLLARMARGTSEPAKIVRGYFQEACRHAAAMKDYRGLLRSAGFAEEAGYADLALEAYLNAARASKDPAVMQRILELQQRRQDPEGILGVVEELVQVLPQSQEYNAARCYLKLLLGRDMEVSTEQVKKGREDDSLSANAAGFMGAFAAYRELDLERVKASLAQVNPKALPAGQRAVFAGLLAVCGETAQAFMIAEAISPNLLLQEERAFLELAL